MSQTESKPALPPKKTESLEIRISPEEKSDFLAACRRAGQTASAVLRNAMRAYVRDGKGRRARRLAMITLPAAAFALGALTLVQIAQTGFADTIVSDVEISVRQVRPSSGSDPETRSARRVETTIELIEGRQTRFFFDDDGPLYFGSLFRAGTDGDGRSVSVEITASRTQEAEEVLYDLIVTLVDADGEVLGDALNPRLLSQAGESVQMTLGVDGPEDMDDWLDIRLTPQIVRAQ